MANPYFNAWLGLRKEKDIAPSTIQGFLKAWRIMELPARIVISAFFATDLAMIAFSVVTAFNMSLLPAYGVFFGLFLALTVGADRTALSFHRTNPEFSATQNAEFAKRLRVELRKVGLKNSEQIEYVRDEAIRLLERKERRRASVVRYAVDIVVLLALASTFNFVLSLLEHDAPLDVALILLAMAAFVSFAIVILVYLFLADMRSARPLPGSEAMRVR